MKRILPILLFCLLIKLTVAQNTIENISRIFKEKNRYYTLVKPKIKKEKWYNLFVRFDSTKVLQTNHVDTENSSKLSSANKWFVCNDSLYYYSVRILETEFNPIITSLYRYQIASAFEYVTFENSITNEARMFQFKIPTHTYKSIWYAQNPEIHTWSDFVYTPKELTVFSSITDTILVKKEIFVRSKYRYDSKEYEIKFPYLGKFSAFKIKEAYYILNDIGEFYQMQDTIPQKIGYFEYKSEPVFFYLMDNDNDYLSFNCKFVALDTKYKNLVRYIDKEHWLYKQYFDIQKKYIKELHKLNEKAWNKKKK